jgi:thiol-disulfide isomerase/thioredoxin
MKTKKLIVIGLGTICLSTICLKSAKAQNEANPTESTRKQLDKLIASTDPADKSILDTKLHQLAASEKEDEMQLAANYFYRNKNAKASDSVLKVEVVKFPLGMQARSVEQQEIYKEKTAAAKEAAYDKWVKKFPPAKFRTGSIEDGILYDYATSSIADEYAKEKNTDKAIEFINKLEADFWKGNAYGGLSGAFHKSGDLVNAEIYAKKAMESAEQYTDGKKGESNAAKFAASGYAGLTVSYASILFEEKKYNEALKYTEISYKNSKQLNPRINVKYAEVLMALDRSQEAFDKLEDVIKSGKATPETAEMFKKLYIKVKGSENGFGEYTAEIRKGVIENLKKKLAKDIVKEPAANFTLTDLDGKKVSLESLRGKTVILDFWATWCGPCKASFPAMQMAQNKFKDDPNVKFLFIHTWEKSTTPEEDAKAYVTSMKYNFEVLMDKKDPETKENKVVTSYKVYGIPAKFVIDPKGNVRFKLTGFDGSNEAAVDELSMMIDMAKAGS